MQPADDKTLVQILQQAGELYDQYMKIPVGSLMVTKDYIFPFVLGRKIFKDFRWRHRRECIYSETGPRILTGDTCVHLTGIDDDCAPHKRRINKSNKRCFTN